MNTNFFTSPVVVTGAAGFIGFHVSQELLRQGCRVVGIDNLNSYYDVSLKHARLKQLAAHEGFLFERADITDYPRMETIWGQHNPQYVVHLAAQAGVRYSIEDPFPYIQSNVNGFLTILELCRFQKDLQHCVYASTSSVYGTMKTMPFSEGMRADTPMSLYAATKKSNELMAQSYVHLYGTPITGLRFFTVYGPWGRPDMSLFKFTQAILEGKPIDVYNEGKMSRDYTYVDDIVQGIIGALKTKSQQKWREGVSHHPIYNLANGHQESLLDFIAEIEKTLGIKAQMNLLPMQLGDVPETSADISAACQDFGYAPQTRIADGVERFVSWYLNEYHDRIPQANLKQEKGDQCQ